MTSEDGREVSPNGFSPEDLAALMYLSERYMQVKRLIAYAEEIQVDHKAYILVHKELRDGLDHLMRVLFCRLSSHAGNQADPNRYCGVNIEKSKGHIYRAAYDALDITILSLKEHISANLSQYSRDTVVAVIQNYYDIKIKLNELSERAADRRGKKDIGTITDSAFDEYIQDAHDLKQIHEKILHAGPELDSHEQDLSWKKWRSRFWGIFLVVLGVVFGRAFGWLHQ
ncbi:MAG: hypothetical protein HQL88_06310 [Magnetococcales bacterium]|nr:hypothetical protein [Magnetococcales bacterium]